MSVAAVVVAGLALATAGVAIAGPGGIAPPSPATPSGDAISQLYWFVFAICAVVFVAVESALILFIVRFRRRRTTPEDAEGPQIHGNTRVEIIWTIVPALILVGIAIVVFARTPAVQATEKGQPDAVKVRVEAHQFYWEYRYPNGGISLDTLVLPVDRPVELELTSFDVNHSWWVHELTGKQDAIPGQVNELMFRPTREGTYEGDCAELCGVLHAVMPTTVEVVSQEEYASRIERLSGQDQPGESQLALGRQSWERTCAKCHGPAGEGDLGPPIARNGTLVDAEALRTLLNDGLDTPDFEGYMPPVGRGWPAFEIEALIEYVRSNEDLAPPEQDGGGSG